MVRRWSRHRETHFVDRVGWLRAAVLGANDGILSVASLITGVASAQADRHGVLLAGVAGWLAGAMSMAAGNASPSVRRPTANRPTYGARTGRARRHARGPSSTN